MANTNEERKRYVKEYIRTLVAIEDAMEPYKEQKRDLRVEFKENGWLNTDEIRAAVKAYRLFRGKINIDEVVENFNMISGNDSEVFINLHNVGLESQDIYHGDKIAQIVMVPVVSFRARKADDPELYKDGITISERGDGALGSTNG